THFMNEAERCDRVSLMDSGRVLATDTPARLIEARGAATLEEAFITYLEDAAPSDESVAAERPDASTPFSLRRLAACTIRETLELVRDPIRVGFAVFGTAFL